MGRKVNYFEAQREYVRTNAATLHDVPTRVVPDAISALETRKARSFWLDLSSWEEAYQDITKLQMRLLMDASDRIVREVRAVRDGDETPLLSQSPDLDPYTLDLTSLLDIRRTQTAIDTRSTAAILASIEQQLITLNAQQQAQGEEIVRIAGIIAGAL